jgi:hypothetical protein
MLFRIVESVKIITGKVVRYSFRYKKRPSKVKPTDTDSNDIADNLDVTYTSRHDTLPVIFFLRDESHITSTVVDKQNVRIRSRQFTTIIRTPSDNLYK